MISWESLIINTLAHALYRLTWLSTVCSKITNIPEVAHIPWELCSLAASLWSWSVNFLDHLPCRQLCLWTCSSLICLLHWSGTALSNDEHTPMGFWSPGTHGALHSVLGVSTFPLPGVSVSAVLAPSVFHYSVIHQISSHLSLPSSSLTLLTMPVPSIASPFSFQNTSCIITYIFLLIL